MPSRNVHVLFVHGVGVHSRLSSLLQAYQAIRSDVRSPESPIEFEDPILNWKLAAFDDGTETPYLKLVPIYPGVQPGPSEAVYLYEVNYSALAGVIRANQPLDITRLFVGFDLAVNVSRERLRGQPAILQPNGIDFDHSKLALHVQKLAGVLVAATVPILGLPSMVLRNFTGTFVATFTRFFEDIATFAMDKNGEQLISAHVDRTVQNILNPAMFNATEDQEFQPDVFVIVAHSLGTIVTHNFVLRHWTKGTNDIPTKVLTFGSPIGLVCWLWLFLDFPALAFNPKQPPGDNYFCWPPLPGTSGALQNIEWINVVNHMDPIATAFPLDYINLAQTVASNANCLNGRQINHRFIRTGGIFSAGSAHTAYYDDREGFLEIVGRLAEVKPGDANEPCTQRPATQHWQEMRNHLFWLRVGLCGLGILAIVAYIVIAAYKYGSGAPLYLLPFYLIPQLTIGFLAFFQKFFFGWPTKRTSLERIETLRWRDWSAFPYLLRRRVGLSKGDPRPLDPRPGWLFSLLTGIVSFLPTLLLMAMPFVLGHLFTDTGPNIINLVIHNWVATLAMLLLFVVYVMSFAASEFVKHWRAIIRDVV